ncbi:MAG: hypothetical protein IJO50_00050 [Clostridia bacterium]|nr:hypothetical protein [Clostridia bacterium]
MKNFLKGDTALKIFSAVIAISLWFYVVQVENPDMDKVVKNVPVVFSNQEAMEARGLVFLNDNEHTINVEIRGSRQYVMDVNSKNLTVLADLGDINAVGQHKVQTNVVLPYANLRLLSTNPSSLTLEVDKLATARKKVEVLTEGNPKDSYAVGNLSAEVQEVTVKGPKTIVDSIQSVAAILDVSGKTADVVGTMPLVVLDTSGKEINSELLSLSETEAEVHAEILKTKTLPLEITYTDSAQALKNDYVLDESSVKKVRIAGAQALLNVMNKVKTKPISDWYINQDGEVTVELDLPIGVRSLDGDSFTLRFNRRLPGMEN